LGFGENANQSQSQLNSQGKHPSLCQVCQTFSDDYYLRTHIQIKLDHNTLARLTKGGVTKSESNAKKSWLTYEEQEVIVDYVIAYRKGTSWVSP